MAKLEIPVRVYMGELEEIINELKHLQTYKLFEGDDTVLIDCDEVVKIFADHLRAEILSNSTIEPEHKWIPCCDRLPESMDFVLLTVRRMDKSYSQRPFISVGYIDMNQISWWCAHDGNCKSANVEVIAWQPLPEPYMEKGDQDD